MKEYKFINLKCKFFSGTYDTDELERIVNAHAAKGWEVNSMTPDNSAAFGKSKNLIILFEREK